MPHSDVHILHCVYENLPSKGLVSMSRLIRNQFSLAIFFSIDLFIYIYLYSLNILSEVINRFLPST